MPKILRDDHIADAEYADSSEPSDWDLYAGRRMKRKPPEITIRCESPLTDYLQVGDLHIVSPKLRELMEEARANVQYLDLPVVHKGRTHKGYAYLNFLDVIDCLDRRRSVIVPGVFPDGDIKRLVLKHHTIGKSPLFVIENALLVGVSDDLAAAIEESNCTGLLLEAPDDWRNPVLGYK